MALKKIYSPPVINQIENNEEWLWELEIWESVTNSEMKKQGHAVYLSLADKIRKSCNNIPVHNLNKDVGFDVLIS